jgi:hypothetical protein
MLILSHQGNLHVHHGHADDGMNFCLSILFAARVLVSKVPRARAYCSRKNDY